MSLEDALARAKRPAGPSCTVSTVRNALNDTDRATLDRALADDTVMHVTIARALVEMGHRMSGVTVSRHRRRECACESR